MTIHDFGTIDENSDAFEFTIDGRPEGVCRLVAVLQTERGPRRTEVATVSAALWQQVAAAAVKELISEMREHEHGKKAPLLKPGLNRLSPLVGRELGVLLLALMEDGADVRVVKLLHVWRELAREERWWLYAKAAAPGQNQGLGWRRALFHALTETTDTRLAPAAEDQKKKLWEHRQTLFEESRADYRSGLPGKAHTQPGQTQSHKTEPAQEGGAKTRPSKRKKTKRPEGDKQLKLF